jgi:hypothetical protein
LNNSLFRPALAVFALTPALCQVTPSFPPWLVGYPGTAATIRSIGSVRQSSYTTSARPAEIIAYYRTEFEDAGVSFQTNPDRLGTSMRATPPECDLFIRISSRPQGASVNTSCSSKSGAQKPSLPTVITSRPQPVALPQQALPQQALPEQEMTATDMMQRHQQIVAEMGIHREHHDEPAPPLVWPPWLVNVNGAALRSEKGVDQSKDAMLRAQYTTNAPMTEIYSFYRDLLNTHEYAARASLSTGQTMTGVRQNALGAVEGSNYPDGAPGARSAIRVSFNRSVLNGPITVTLRFTTHEYIAKRGY